MGDRTQKLEKIQLRGIDYAKAAFWRESSCCGRSPKGAKPPAPHTGSNDDNDNDDAAGSFSLSAIESARVGWDGVRRGEDWVDEYGEVEWDDGEEESALSLSSDGTARSW